VVSTSNVDEYLDDDEDNAYDGEDVVGGAAGGGGVLCQSLSRTRMRWVSGRRLGKGLSEYEIRYAPCMNVRECCASPYRGPG
jgi:hypothetical protein